MKKHSCGAIFYTIKDNKVYIILGKEKGDWFPFKGTCEYDETYEETAVREILEESCGIVNISPDNIILDCHYSTSRKYYHIGLVYVLPTMVNDFYKIRRTHTSEKYLEKTDVKMFNINNILYKKMHHITMTPIIHYFTYLKDVQYKLKLDTIPQPLSEWLSKQYKVDAIKA